MAKSKIREVTIRESQGSFSLFNEKNITKESYNFDGLDSLRKLLSKEKARILDVIKVKKPKSIYELSKILNRPFKAVIDDIKLLERFGLVNLVEEKTKKRVRHRPEVSIDHLIIHLKISLYTIN